MTNPTPAPDLALRQKFSDPDWEKVRVAPFALAAMTTAFVGLGYDAEAARALRDVLARAGSVSDPLLRRILLDHRGDPDALRRKILEERQLPKPFTEAVQRVREVLGEQESESFRRALLSLGKHLVEASKAPVTGPVATLMEALAGKFLSVPLDAVDGAIVPEAVDFSPFTADEWNRLREAPGHVLLAVVSTYGGVDPKRLSAFSSLLEAPWETEDPWLRRILADQDADAPPTATFPGQGADPLKELSALCELVKQRLDKDASLALRGALFGLGLAIAGIDDWKDSVAKEPESPSARLVGYLKAALSTSF